MQRHAGPSAIHRLLGAVVGLLVAAIALRWAVQIVESIWLPLLVSTAVIAAAGTAVALFRARYRSW